VIIWVDAQLSPALAPWITAQFGIEAASTRYLRLVRAKDREIFLAARVPGTAVLTKDSDFVVLVNRLAGEPLVEIADPQT
jgi:predicted nuclease of predicted toxin-antitoxin system